MSPWDPLSLFPSTGITSECPHACFCLWVPGVELRCSCLQSRHSTHGAVPRPFHGFKTISLLPNQLLCTIFPRRQLEFYKDMNGEWLSITILNWFSIILLTPVDLQKILSQSWERRNKDWGFSVSSVKLHNRAIEIKTAWYEHRPAGQCNMLESPDVSACVSWSSTWVSRTHVGGGLESLIYF